MRHVYWVEGRVRQISSPYRVRGETGYAAQEDLKSINSYKKREGKTTRVWFFHSCIARPSLVSSALLSLGHHIPPSHISRANSLASFDTLLVSVYLFPFSGIWEPSLRGKGAMTTLASSGCTGASWGSGFPCLLSVRCIYGGR